MSRLQGGFSPQVFIHKTLQGHTGKALNITSSNGLNYHIQLCIQVNLVPQIILLCYKTFINAYYHPTSRVHIICIPIQIIL